jgi:signal transduction histidine kinase/DNA-binding response OmpR family regulator
VILGRPTRPGHVVLVHRSGEAAEALAKGLRGAGHRVTCLGPGARVLQSVIEATPDLLVGSTTAVDPPIAAVIRGARQALGEDLPVLVLLDDAGASGGLIPADDIVREPVDTGELDLRVGSLLRAQAERRVLRRKVQEMLGLYKVSWGVSLAGGADALSGHFARQSAELLGAQKGLVLTFDPERRQMVAQPPGFGFPRDRVTGLRYSVDGEARSRWNFRTNGPLISNNSQADTRLLPDVVSELDIRSLVAAPLTRGPKILGLLVVANRASGAPFTEDDLNLLIAVAGLTSVAVENLRLHDEIKRANALLQEYDRLKSEFVATVAHDFRKPLMAIRGFAELLLEEPDLPMDARTEFMRTVISESEGLAALADDTLLITRIETGEFSHRWREVDLGPFILECVPLGLSDHSVLMDIPRGFPQIIADPDRLRQVMNNLTSNAVKYSPSGGSIIVRARERGPHHVVVEVIDHGLGIPKDQVDRLFRKFQRVRTEEHLAIQGTGLGLYICRLIVEGHGGQMWVESELGKGSTFGLVLPKDARAATRQRKAASAEAASSLSRPDPAALAEKAEKG